jgi:hypothetical protein
MRMMSSYQYFPFDAIGNAASIRILILNLTPESRFQLRCSVLLPIVNKLQATLMVR